MNSLCANREGYQLQPAFHIQRKVIMFLQKIFPFAAASVVAVSGAFAMSAPQAFAEFTSTSLNADNTAASGVVQVDLVDQAGAVLSNPIVNITNAAPSMATRSNTIKIKNNGTLPSAVLLHSGNLVVDPTSDLNDVLVATIKDSTNNVLYTGTLENLSVSFAEIAAGATVTLTLEITWPDLAEVNDNPYQDAAMSFSIIADASNLIG